MTLVAASWTKIVPKTRKTREFWENVPGRLIQSCTIAVARNSNAITKFLVGSGCWPLKIRNANPNESGKNEDFDVGCRLETAQQFVAGATTSRLFRSEPAPEK